MKSLHCPFPAFRPSLLALAISAALLPAARADDATTLATLPEVVVTSTVDQSPLTVVTDPKIPRQPIPTSDGADYLETIPGFSTIRNGGTNGDPVFRGMYGSRLNILTDEASMLGACPGRMDNPLSYIVPENFDELTVIKGPETVIWGPMGSAATIRFDRNTQPFTAPGVRGDGGLVLGSWQRRDVSADVAAGNANGYVRVIGSYGSQNNYVDGNGQTVPSAWMKWGTDAIFGWTPSQDTLLEITAGTGDGEATYVGRSMDGSQFLREAAGIRLQQQNLGDVVQQLVFQYNYNYADHVMDNYSLRDPDPMSMMPDPVAAEVDRRTQSARLAATLTLTEAISLETGVDYTGNVHRGRDAMGRDAYLQQAWQTDARMSNTGVFGELNWQAGNLQRVIAGLRIDYARATDERQTIGYMMPMPNPTAGVTRSDTLPSGFVRYELDTAGKAATWYAGLGYVERFPDYWELFSANTGPTGSVNAFSAIQPEKTTQLDFGVTMKQPGMEAWVSAYAGYIQDYILFLYGNGGMMGSTSQVINVNAQIAGAELGGKVLLASNWVLDGSLAYAWGQDTTLDMPLPQMPPLDARIGLRYETPKWSLGGLWRVVAAQDRYALDQGNVVGKDFGPSAGFGVVSLNGSYTLDKQLILTVGIDNLFNKQYTEHLNLAGDSGFGYSANQAAAEPGRSFWMNLRGSF